MVKARNYFNSCRALGIEPGEAVRILREALEMEISGNAGSDGDDGKARDDLFTRRQYGGNYREP
jgi:hypothetical protein